MYSIFLKLYKLQIPFLLKCFVRGRHHSFIRVSTNYLVCITSDKDLENPMKLLLTV